MTARLTFTVYSRSDCHLCDEMIAALRELQRRFRFDLAVVDVDSDARLAHRHGGKVPVVAHGERELCHAILDRAAVTAPLPEFR